MLRQETLSSGLTHTWSSEKKRIRQVETGFLFDDAIDSNLYTYEETDEPITVYEMDATDADYQAALNELGVRTSDQSGT